MKATQQYCIISNKGLPVTTAFLMIIIIATSTILQPALGTTTTNLSTKTTTPATETEYNPFILVPLNQSSTSLADKTNVTLRGLFNIQFAPGKWNQLLQPALDEL